MHLEFCLASFYGFGIYVNYSQYSNDIYLLFKKKKNLEDIENKLKDAHQSMGIVEQNTLQPQKQKSNKFTGMKMLVVYDCTHYPMLHNNLAQTSTS